MDWKYYLINDVIYVATKDLNDMINLIDLFKQSMNDMTSKLFLDFKTNHCLFIDVSNQKDELLIRNGIHKITIQKMLRQNMVNDITKEIKLSYILGLKI